MTTAFAKLPLTITVGASVTFADSVIVTPSESDVNARKALRGVLCQYMCTVNPEDSAEVIKIVRAHYGRRYPFAMRDLMAYEYSNEELEPESATVWKLQRTWTPTTGGRSEIERILIPDITETPTVVKVNGVTNPNWSFTDYGKIQFTASPATVSESDVVTASGQYLKAVTLAENASATILTKGLFRFEDLRLNEISEAELTQLLLT